MLLASGEAHKAVKNSHEFPKALHSRTFPQNIAAKQKGSCCYVNAATLKVAFWIVCTKTQHTFTKSTWRTLLATRPPFCFCFGLTVGLGVVYLLPLGKYISKFISKVGHELSVQSHWGRSGGLAAVRCCRSQTTKPSPVLRLYPAQVYADIHPREKRGLWHECKAADSFIRREEGSRELDFMNCSSRNNFENSEQLWALICFVLCLV